MEEIVGARSVGQQLDYGQKEKVDIGISLQCRINFRCKVCTNFADEEIRCALHFNSMQCRPHGSIGSLGRNGRLDLDRQKLKRAEETDFIMK